jgi:tripartite-type tricarboxylate transporter receptor subunit TctC
MIEIATRTLADGTMGAEEVLHAAPDGNTVLMTSNVFIINPYVRTVHYDPVTSFEPVCYLARLPEVVVVSGASPYRTLADLLSAARTSPADVTMASFGPSGSSHIAVEMLKLLYGAERPSSSIVVRLHVFTDTRGDLLDRFPYGSFRVRISI